MAKAKYIILHAVSGILGLFFVYAGIAGLFFKKPRKQGAENAVENSFMKLIAAFRETAYFMPMVKWFELICGVLIIIPKTRLIGALALLPITFNIFTIHLMLDPRVDEWIETGLLFFANVTIVLFYFKKLILHKPDWQRVN